MKTAEIAKLLDSNTKHVRKYKGVYRYHLSYYYRHGNTPQEMVEFVKSKIPSVEVIGCGDHMHAFVGGAKSGSAKDSFMWVTFTV